MLLVEDCLQDDTPIYMTMDVNPKKSFFTRVEKPRKFYVKKFNPSEFIGEELCLTKKVRCAHYFLVAVSPFAEGHTLWYSDINGKYYDLRLASHNFKDKKHTYKTATKYGFEQYRRNVFEHMLSIANGEENKKQLLEEMLQLLALDLYSGQTDRLLQNFMFEEDADHNIHLAPVYDFEFSFNAGFFEDDSRVGYGDLKSFYTIEECREFISKYPRFGELLSSYLCEDLESIVRLAYSKRRMHLPEEMYPAYREFDEGRKELIKRIVR